MPDPIPLGDRWRARQARQQARERARIDLGHGQGFVVHGPWGRGEQRAEYKRLEAEQRFAEPLPPLRPGEVSGGQARWVWCAVLMQAVCDLRGQASDLPPDCRDAARRAAWGWIVSRNMHVGSFLWVCEQLDLDADAVRLAVLRSSADETPPRSCVAAVLPSPRAR